MKKFFLFVSALSVCAFAADGSVEERVGGLQAQVDRAMSKAGIHVNGEFRSQFLNSSLEGDAVGAGKKSESVEYTSVDFDIVARPNTALSARAMFRLHQDWRNFFSDVQNPITTRWLSIDGSLMQGVFKYNLGDYRRKLTPLTLWAPDVDFLYEPEIFAQNRRLAMSEAFVGDNNRALQGVNLEFKAELWGSESPILSEISADVFGARLAAAGTGESGVIPPGIATEANGDYWDAPYDKYLVGANLGTQIIKGAGLGVSNILIFDYVDSYRLSPDSIAAKLNAEMTNILAGRANLDTRMFRPDDFLNIGLNFEAALSSDNKPYIDPNDSKNVLDSTVTGLALNAGLAARVALGEDNTLKLSADWIHNEASFRNEAAQSPTFIQRAIMNNENPLEGLGLLNPFDALYRSVFKYTPSQYFGGSKPYTKNSYISPILFKAVPGSGYKYPSIFQAALPGGMATADRSGPVGQLSGSFLDGGITIGAKGAMVTTYEEYDWLNPENADDTVKFKPEFLEIVVGAGLDIAKFAPILGPSLQIGGSLGLYNVKNGSGTYDPRTGDDEVKNTLLNFGLNYNFVPRFSVLLGYQLLTSDVPRQNYEKIDVAIYDVKYDYEFSNLAFGLSYKVADGGILTAKVSMLSGKKTSTDGKVSKIQPEPQGNGPWESYTDDKSYTAWQPEVYLTVKF